MSDDVKKPYKASYGHDGKYYVEGPAEGGECSYYGLYSSLRFGTEEEAKKAGIGYAQGIKRAQLIMRTAVGICIRYIR